MLSITVFFAVTMSLIIFIAIGWNIRSIIRYRKAVANLKVGDTYISALEDCDPFINVETYGCTIKEIRYDKRRRPHVKFEYSDGTIDTMLFYDFINEFNKVN